MKQTKLKTWQQDLYQEIKDRLLEFKDRKVIWVEDTGGNTGKSYFQKWLALGQIELVVLPLAISNVDRLKSAVCNINKTFNVDVYTINFTRTKGEGESYKDIFHAIEDIKDGVVIDTMYGKYNRSYFEPPVVIIFTNNPLVDALNPFLDFFKYLSDDRWVHYKIIKNELYELTQQGTPCLTKVNRKVDTKVENRATVNDSIEY